MQRVVLALIGLVALIFVWGGEATMSELSDSIPGLRVVPLEGMQAVPPVDTGAEGSCNVLLNANQTELWLECQNNVSNVVGAHIHEAPSGVNGPIVFFLDAGTTFGATVNQAALDDQETQRGYSLGFDSFLGKLKAGDLYVNVHSTTNPTGEIRGQIPPPPSVLYFPQFGNGVPPGSSVGLQSDIVLLNSSSTGDPITGQVFFTDDNGGPLTVSLGPGDPPTEITGSGEIPGGPIAPLAQRTLSTDGMGDVIEGTATVVLDGPHVGGVVRFAITEFGIAGVQTATPLGAGIIPVRNQNGVQTGVAIMNTFFGDITVSLSLLQDGVEVLDGSAEMMLPYLNKRAEYIDELFPAADLEGFVGTLKLEITGSESLVPERTFDPSMAIIGLELGKNTGEFTTLPAKPIGK